VISTSAPTHVTLAIMKRIVSFSTLLAAGVVAAQTAPAQTAPAHPAVHHSAAGACVKLPELSSKIPALPEGTPCAKHLYTIAIKPSAELSFVAPIASSTDLRETLRLQEASSFSLDYIDVKAGSGAPVAPHKWLTVKYSGYLTDGTKFDSSYDHPTDPPFAFQYGQIGGPGGAVPGWETGFEGMRIGAKRRLIIPYQLGYGAQARPKIPPKSTLIFDVELVAISDTNPNPPKTPPTPAQRPAVPGAAPGTPPVIKPAPAPTPPPATAPAATPPASTPPGTTTPKP
jgi:peptidylprolyl isomerase